MTFPTVVTEADLLDDVADTSASFTLPTWSEQSGDLVLILSASRDNASVSSPTAGWTEFIDTGGNDGDLHGHWARSTGSNLSGSTFAYTTSAATKHPARCIVLRGAADPSVDPPEATTSTGDSGNPNPPSHTASWASGEDNLVIYAAGYKSTASVTADPTTPATPTNTFTSNTTGGGGACTVLGGMFYDAARDTVDPGVITVSISNDWNAATIFIRPAADTGITASGTPSIPAVTASGAAEVIKGASGTPSMPAIEGDGMATVVRVASGAATLPLLEASGAASVGAVITASGSPSIAAVEAIGAATVVRVASGAASLPSIEASGAATVAVQASDGAPFIGAPIAAGISLVSRQASGAPSVPAITAAGVATVSGTTTASGAPSIPAVVAAGNADVTAACSETLAPDTIAEQTNLAGVVGDIDDDPFNPDANWLTLDVP